MATTCLPAEGFCIITWLLRAYQLKESVL